MGRKASTGFFTKEREYDCQFDWPEDCKVQGGDKGIVFDKKAEGGSYRTSFFEAFPRNPDTFIRGEGKSMQEAEQKAWEKYQRYLACPADHEDPDNFERRGYKNGAGFCKECGLFRGKMFEPTEKCHNCGTATYYTSDKHGRYWCEDCSDQIPEEDLSELQKMIRRVDEEGLFADEKTDD